MTDRGATDPYVDPTTGVFRNRLGITTQNELAEAEADFTAVRLAQIARSRIDGIYDLELLRTFHARIFGDVYPWAGELRTVAIDKGVPFCPPQHLAAYAEDVFSRLASKQYLHGRGTDAFVDGLSELVSDLNALHPFREGNGRTLRAFTSQLARDAGHEVRWAGMDPAENIDASRAALAGNNTPLRIMLQRLVDRPDPGATAPRPRRPR